MKIIDTSLCPKTFCAEYRIFDKIIDMVKKVFLDVLIKNELPNVR